MVNPGSATYAEVLFWAMSDPYCCMWMDMYSSPENCVKMKEDISLQLLN